MNKKRNVIYGIIATIIIFLFIFIFAYGQSFKVIEFNKIDGNYFDDSGKHLGICVIESVLHKIDTNPTVKTYFYDLNGKILGICENTYGSFIPVLPGESKESLNICDNPDLQKIYKEQGNYSVTQKYNCKTKK